MCAFSALAAAALALVAHAGDAAQVAKGRIEGADGAVWLGVFGDDAKEASWTQVESGDFEVELPPGESATILAIAKDRIPRTIPVASDAADAIAVRLSPGLALAGTVRSENGMPLVAEITARPAQGHGFDVPAFAAPRWRSVPTGEFEIGGLRPGRYAIEASAEGHVPLVLDDVLIRDEESNWLTLELAVAAFVAGRVVDGEGGPAVDVEVRTVLDESIAVRSGADGAFRLGPFSVGQSVEVFARSAELDSTRRRYVHAPYQGLLLEFPRHALLGQVLDAATGAPVQRYRVVLSGRSSSQWEHRIEAEDGMFRVPLDAEAHSVVVHAEGYSPWVSDTSRCDEECRLGTIPLQQQLSIAGRVVDARSGQPIAGATFDIFGWRGPARSRSYYFNSLLDDVRTDADGTFELSGLPSIPTSFVVVAPGYHRKEIALPPFDSLLEEVDTYEDGPFEANGWPSVVVGRIGAGTKKVVLAPTTTGLVVQLDFRDAGPTISGRLTLADGTPVAGSVSIFRTDGSSISLPPPTPWKSNFRVTDENGEFRYEGLDLPDGEYWLDPRSSAGVMDGRAVVVENGQSVENIQLLVRAGRQLRITIAGLQPTAVTGGEPFDGMAEVTIENEEGRHLFMKRYRNGTHLLRGLPEELLFVSADARPHMLMREVPTGESEVEFDFTRGRSRVAGTVTMEGRPLPDFVVRAAPLAPSGLSPLRGTRAIAFVEARTTDSGHYDARGLSEGPHVVMTPTGHFFEVYVAGDTVFDIDLPPISLSGVVRARETGLPVGYALVRLYRAEGDSWSEALSDRADVDGRFRFDGLAAGEHHLDITVRRFDRLSQRIQVVGHEVLELELEEQSR